MKTIFEPARDIPVRAEADIVVVGGGPSGIMAAYAAAGEGKKVMLLESRGYLGGNLTLGLPILAYLDVKGKQCIKGFAQELIDRSAELGEVYRQLADRLGILVADAADWHIDLAYDGVHFSPSGHSTFADELWNFLAALPADAPGDANL